MSYQSKTYSLSDEVIAAIEAARERGETPNRFLRRLTSTEKNYYVAPNGYACNVCAKRSTKVINGVPIFPCAHHNGQRRVKGDAKR